MTKSRHALTSVLMIALAGLMLTGCGLAAVAPHALEAWRARRH